MDNSEIRKLSALEDTYWWFVGRRVVVASILERYFKGTGGKIDILDFGSGTGGNFSLLTQWGKVQGVEVSELAIKLSRARYKDTYVHHLNPHSPLPFLSDSFDVVVLLDVLEHIKDDRRVLGDLKRILKNNGKLLLTVPCHPWLWSNHDEALGHFRRYTINDLRDKLQKVGFKIDYLTYFMFCLILPLIFYRLIAKVLRFEQGKRSVLYPLLPGWLNWVLIFFMRGEALWFKRSSLPFGTSILVLATKATG